MFEDEKIASLERYRRQVMRDEQEKETEVVKEEKKAALTLEEALEGLENGELVLKTREKMEFEFRTYFEKKISIPLFKNFYEASEENGESIVFMNHDNQVSQVASFLRENIRTITMEQWSNLLVNGMARNNLFVKIVKKKQLDNMEYICYEVPSGKGWVYNIMFRMKGKDKRFTGNFSCMKKNEETYGIVLEAMVMKMDKLFHGQ